MAGAQPIRTIPNAELADLLVELLQQGQTARFHVWGSSMLPSLRGGDLVELEQASPTQLRVGDVVAVKTIAGDLVVHRLAGKTKRGTTWWMVLWAEAGEGLQGPMPDTCLIGRVCSVERDGQTTGFFRAVPRLVRWRAGFYLLCRRCLGSQTRVLRPLRAPGALFMLSWRAVRSSLARAVCLRPVSRAVRGPDEQFHEDLVLTSMPSGAEPDAGWQWVAVHRGRAIGGLTVSPDFGEAISRRSWWLTAQWVTPWHRRRGVYRRLIRAALDFARSEGVESVFAAVRRDNVASRTALEREGFVRDDDAELLGKVEQYYEEVASWPPGSIVVLRADLASSANRPN